MVQELKEQGVLHVRYEGRSFDLRLSDLDVGPASVDSEIRKSVAASMNVPAGNFQHYVIDRHETGNLTLRPEAVFG